MVTANLKPIAVDWQVDNIPVTLVGLTMTTVTFARNHRSDPQWP